MPKFRLGHVFVAVMLLVAMLAQGTWALAGTTGRITGTLTDSKSGKPVADAKITAVSPSESASTTTDASGSYGFLNLAPDTYTVSADKAGYAPASVAGVTVFADQSVTVPLTTQPALKTIANVTSRAAGNLVKAGTTSDVYSVNAATQQVVSGGTGGFNLNSAYSGIYSQPGVTSYVGNYGWGQVFYIRGSAYSQIGYEFDGVPVNRAFDNYQANSLSSLGQQELQVYTGGSPSGSSSATLGGFINQVIKTGTYPGFGYLVGGIGAPGFYHGLTAEAGGATPNRNFSYYVGLMGFNQHYPYGNWQNFSGIGNNGQNQYGLSAPAEIATPLGALLGYINSAPPDFNGTQCATTGVNCGWSGQFLNGPFPACQANGVPSGYSAANPGAFNGTCYGYTVYGNGYLSDQFERDNVVNLHFGIPHHNDSGKDDIQLLYDNSMQYMTASSSINDNGGINQISQMLTPFSIYSTPGNPYPGLCGYENSFGLGCASVNSPLPYTDSKIFAPGTSFGQPANTAVVDPYYFPSSPTNRPLNAPFAPTYGLPLSNRDGQLNNVGIVKLQYTKNIGSNAYARLFGYTFYSDWMLNGPDCAATGYFDGLLAGGLCGETADYELATHTRGAQLDLADQINPQNLLQFTANYTTAGVTRFNNSSFYAGFAGSRTGVTNLTNGDPNNPVCYQWDPFLSDGVTPNPNAGQPGSCFSSSTYGTYWSPTRGAAGETPDCTNGPAKGGLAGTPACTSGAKWLVTVPGGQGTYNTVKPIFTSYALQDDLKPNDKLDFNIGVRMESYRYDLTNTNTPEYNFWFNQGAEVNCYDPATGLPQLTPLAPGQPVPPAGVQTNPFGSCGLAPSGKQGLHPIGPTLAKTPAGAACVAKGFCSASQFYTAVGPSSFTHTMVSPRLGMTWTLSPDTVFRASAGKYTQPTETAFEQYLDQSAKRAAAFNFSQFWGLGFNSPAHDNPVEYSNNYDFSIEHHLHGTDMTFKVSPFYRDTHNEIVTVVLGPGFVSGVNVGHQHSTGVEFAFQKGDPTRDGFSGQFSYTYTRALLQYGDLPNGTNAIDYLNNYVKAFNALTSSGGGAKCYYLGTADNACAAPPGGNAAFVIKNPYYGMAQQSMLAPSGWYPSYPNEPPNDPGDQGGSTAISPHTFQTWVQYKRGRFSIAPNFTLQAGTSYGSPTDTYGIDPRACGQNEGAAINAAGKPVVGPGSAYAQDCDFLTASASPYVQSGSLAIPNPFTGRMDTMGQFQQPWQFNMSALIRYEISPKIMASLNLTNIVNTCFGGSSTPWSTAFKPGSIVCGYGQNNGSFLGTQPGAGFFYGGNPGGAINGGQPYERDFNYPFGPFFGSEPFQAYLQLQIKL